MARNACWLLMWAALLQIVVVLVTGLSWWVWDRYASTPRERLVHGLPEERQWAIRMLAEGGAVAP